MNRGLVTLLVAAALVVGGVAALASFLSGGGVGPLDPVAKAGVATAAAGSADISISGGVTAAGQTIPLDGSGAVDPQNLRAHLSMSTNVPGVGSLTVEEIMNGAVIYMKMPGALASRIPGGKQWMKVDLQQFGKSAGIDMSKLMGSSPNQANPAEMLKWLKAVGDSHVVGHDSIRGTDTTHYSANVDIGRVAGQIGDKQAEQSLKQLYRSIGVSNMPVDVWVDGSGLVRRETVAMNGTSGPAGGVSMNMTIDYLKFGVTVDASPPPADQVFDLSSIVGGATRGLPSG